MKVLSGYVEWFWLMAVNLKDVENRPWPLGRYFKPLELPIRIYLHASKTKAPQQDIAFIRKTLKPEDVKRFEAVDWSRLRGRIIGEVTITGTLHKNSEAIPPTHTIYAQDVVNEVHYLKEHAPEYFSKWFFGPHGFIVKQGVLYDRPVPCRGQLGFFDAPPEVEAQIRRIYAESH